MKRKNCKITIEYKQSDFFGTETTYREYYFNDYRIATAVANLLDNINSKWIRKKCWKDTIIPPTENFMNPPE